MPPRVRVCSKCGQRVARRTAGFESGMAQWAGYERSVFLSPPSLGLGMIV